MTNSVIKLSIIFMSLLLISCSERGKDRNSQKETETIKTIVQPEKAPISNKQNSGSDRIYFKASGTEPFWALEISEKEIKLRMPEDSIIVPAVDPVRAMDGNVKSYRSQTGTNQIKIQIIQSECTNAMSGKVSPYSITVEYKRNTDQEFHKIKGCGSYITDYRLHDIWVLETLKGVKMDTSSFNKELPVMEINSAANTFIGFAGCNTMNGSLFFEEGLLRFTNIATTRKRCLPTNQEDAFLKALRSATTYKIENNRLWLSNPSESLLTLRKVD